MFHRARASYAGATGGDEIQLPGFWGLAFDRLSNEEGDREAGLGCAIMILLG